jgi:hypothetical protein
MASYPLSSLCGDYSGIYVGLMAARFSLGQTSRGHEFSQVLSLDSRREAAIAATTLLDRVEGLTLPVTLSTER